VNPSKPTRRRIILAILSLFGLGALFVTNPVTRLMYRGTGESLSIIAMRGFVAPLHGALMAGAVVGFTHLLRRKGDRVGLVAGSFVLIGLAAGIRILELGQLEGAMAAGTAGIPPDTLDRLFRAAPKLWLSIVPTGILFPIGMVLLGLTLAVTKPIPRVFGALLALGGALFPIGRIGHFPWAFLACDLILGGSFLLVGWQLAVRKDLWGETA
ncbi:MAG TPA: hypothetical protein VN181_12845, partial [Thermoanaerobaculia bacterium]|nr:hypothetical protein [Thermoanaerobaculia bacterium]